MSRISKGGTIDISAITLSFQCFPHLYVAICTHLFILHQTLLSEFSDTVKFELLHTLIKRWAHSLETLLAEKNCPGKYNIYTLCYNEMYLTMISRIFLTTTETLVVPLSIFLKIMNNKIPVLSNCRQYFV